jgi:hypothetical protein
MKRLAPWLVLALCLALLVGTFQMLLRGRIERGDIYPPSSSLRSDPLGTMLLYESLAALPGVTVRRDTQDGNRLPDRKDTTYLHLAARPEDWMLLPKTLHREVDRYLLAGGRLVVTFAPEFEEKSRKDKEEGDKHNTPAPDEKKIPIPDDIDEPAEPSGWFSVAAVGGKKDGRPHLARRVGDGPLPAELAWHGDVVLTEWDASWTPIYERAEGPVVAQRQRGAGTLVVATDSYFLSNEALVKDRHPTLLAWIIGPSREVVFDEAHHGVIESPGIAALARKYRLHGGALVVVILAGLFVWKNSSALAPLPTAAAQADGSIAGRDTVSGFTALLRRNLPKSTLLATCLAEWQKVLVRNPRFTPSQRQAAERLLTEAIAQPSADPVTVYRRVRETLHRRT